MFVFLQNVTKMVFLGRTQRSLESLYFDNMTFYSNFRTPDNRIASAFDVGRSMYSCMYLHPRSFKAQKENISDKNRYEIRAASSRREL